MSLLKKYATERDASGIPHAFEQKQIFLLSPAHCGGKRASYLFNEFASFDLARDLRRPRGAALGDIFSFVSGLYFRGKLAYARAFARPPRGASGVFVITPERGLVVPEERIAIEDLRALAEVPIKLSDPRYHGPLRRDLAKLGRRLQARCSVVFLGSIATPKYLEILVESFKDRVVVPAQFPGRGDMSRGGLLLRSVREGRELTYIPALAAYTPRLKRTPRE
jgi:hypothetical protein